MLFTIPLANISSNRFYSLAYFVYCVLTWVWIYSVCWPPLLFYSSSYLSFFTIIGSWSPLITLSCTCAWRYIFWYLATYPFSSGLPSFKSFFLDASFSVFFFDFPFTFFVSWSPSVYVKSWTDLVLNISLADLASFEPSSTESSLVGSSLWFIDSWIICNSVSDFNYCCYSPSSKWTIFFFFI